MKTSVKIGGFVVGLAAALTLSYGVGNAVGPVGTAADTSGGHDMSAQSSAPSSTSSSSVEIPGGLMVSENGYTLQLDQPVLTAGAATTVSFRIVGPDGNPVTDYVTNHDKDLHFIAVRQDTTGFQHVHPTIDASGTWTTQLDLTAGDWRFFADFQAAGTDEGLTLGVDAAVAGNYDPQPLPAESRTAQVDGYTVTLAGDLVSGTSSELTLNVSRDGQPVTDLQPYLGAYGHLVALRSGDLAYLHVHPAGEPGDGVTQPGPDITFYATVPSVGTYRLYLDFQIGDQVRTAEFTLATTDADAASAAPSTVDHSGMTGMTTSAETTGAQSHN